LIGEREQMWAILFRWMPHTVVAGKCVARIVTVLTKMRTSRNWIVSLNSI